MTSALWRVLGAVSECLEEEGIKNVVKMVRAKGSTTNFRILPATYGPALEFLKNCWEGNTWFRRL